MPLTGYWTLCRHRLRCSIRSYLLTNIPAYGSRPDPGSTAPVPATVEGAFGIPVPRSTLLWHRRAFHLRSYTYHCYSNPGYRGLCTPPISDVQPPRTINRTMSLMLSRWYLRTGPANSLPHPPSLPALAPHSRKGKVVTVPKGKVVLRCALPSYMCSRWIVVI